MSTPANALDITAAGLVKFDGSTSFSGVTVTNHATLVGAASNGVTSLALGSSGQVLTSNGAGADPSYASISNANLPGSGQINLANGTNVSVSGSPVALGGTATINVSGPPSATTLTSNGVVLGNGSSAVTATSAGTDNTVLVGHTGLAPSFGTVPNAALANSSVTLSNGTNISVSGSPLSLGGTATINVAGPISPTSYTSNGVIYGNSTSALQATSAGTDNTVLLGHTGLAPSFGTVPNAALTNSSVTLSNGTNISISGSPLSLGGTATVNVSGPITPTSYTSNGVLYGNSSSALQVTAAGTTGQVLTATTSAAPAWQSPGPLACSFSAYQATNASNVTGDGTLYTVGVTTAFTEYFDLGSNFNTNGTFTAPVAGYYFFTGTVFFNNISTSMTSGAIYINNSGNQTFQSNSFSPAAVKDNNNLVQMTCTAFMHCNANDTVFLQVKISNGTKTATVVGSVANSPQTWFSGYLVQRG